jgi:hypothetical protein
LFLLFTTQSDKAEDVQLVIACETESQIFVLSHVWEYYGSSTAAKAFASYAYPEDPRKEPVCFSVEVTELHYVRFPYSTWLLSAGQMYPYTVYQSATRTHDNLHILSDGELINK